MNQSKLSPVRVRRLLAEARKAHVLVVGDVMLDQFIWGSVARISPEAPVPVVDFERESFMPGGAANVARNLTALKVPTELFGTVGHDHAAEQLKLLLHDQHIASAGLIATPARRTSVKTRIVASMQQVVRIDRETRDGLSPQVMRRLVDLLDARSRSAAAVVVCD